MCDCQQQGKEWGELATKAGEVDGTSRGPELSKSLSDEKNRFIENSCARSHGRPLCPPAVFFFQQVG